MIHSEVARIKAEIESTYLTAKFGLSGLASGTFSAFMISSLPERNWREVYSLAGNK